MKFVDDDDDDDDDEIHFTVETFKLLKWLASLMG